MPATSSSVERWNYVRRPDGRISITLDNNVWDFLYLHRDTITLADELPRDQFALFIPRQVEIEALAIPATQLKQPLKNFVAETIKNCEIVTAHRFGFALPEGAVQRSGGFNVGTFPSATEREFYAAISEQLLMVRPERGSRLTDNEGDAAVAIASFSSVVMTNERRNKNGPIRFAAERGGKVFYLNDFNPSEMSLRESIVRFEQTESLAIARVSE